MQDGTPTSPPTGHGHDLPPWVATGTLHSPDESRMGAWLFAVCLLFIGAGATYSTLTATTMAEPVLVIGDVSEAQIVEIRDPSGKTVLYGEFRSSVDALGNVEKDAALMDRNGRVVIGEVEIEVPSADRPDRQVELEVDIIGLTPRARLALYIDDRLVAHFTTDDRGSIDRELREGEPSAQ